MCKRNPVFTAIETLKEPEEIKQFVKEYEEYMLTHCGRHPDHPEDEQDLKTVGHEIEIARSNVGYILGYYSDGTARRWYSALPNISHPVFGHGFGRGKDPTPKEAFDTGRKMGENSRNHD
jgi:hypothetical protein